jgi:hypothetical protein
VDPIVPVAQTSLRSFFGAQLIVVKPSSGHSSRQRCPVGSYVWVPRGVVGAPSLLLGHALLLRREWDALLLPK